MTKLIKSNLHKLPPLPTILDLLRLYRLRALRKLSQNFLVDERLINKIVKAAGPIEDGFVCEVGPGPGGITRSILNRSPREILLVEKDERFKPMIDPLIDACSSFCNINAVYADILDFDLMPFCDEKYGKEWNDDDSPNIHLIGNLPFDVSTILIIRWLNCISTRENIWRRGRVKMTLTFQKEVAERIVAPALSKQRCRLSVMCQNWCMVDERFTIPGKAFLPKPKVDASVVHFVPLVKPIIPLRFDLVEKLLRTVFGYRQKFIVKGIRKLFPLTLTDKLSEELLAVADVDPKMRPYQLSNEEWGRLCHAYNGICLRQPDVFDYCYRGPQKERELPWQDKKEEEEEEKEKDDDDGKTDDVIPSRRFPTRFSSVSLSNNN